MKVNMKCSVKKCGNEVVYKVKSHAFCRKHFTKLKGLKKVKLTKKSVNKNGVTVYDSDSNYMIAAYIGSTDSSSGSSSSSSSSSSGSSCGSSCGGSSSSGSSCGSGCGGAGCGS